MEADIESIFISFKFWLSYTAYNINIIVLVLIRKSFLGNSVKN